MVSVVVVSYDNARPMTTVFFLRCFFFALCSVLSPEKGKNSTTTALIF